MATLLVLLASVVIQVILLHKIVGVPLRQPALVEPPRLQRLPAARRGGPDRIPRARLRR